MLSYDLHKLQIIMLNTVFVEINMQSTLAAECELKIIIAYKSEF